MTTCANACPQPAVMRVNHEDFCARHANEAVTNKVQLSWLAPARTQKVSTRKLRRAKGRQMLGSLPAFTEVAVGASPQSGRPTVRSGMWVNQFRIRVTDPRTAWRTSNV